MYSTRDFGSIGKYRSLFRRWSTGIFLGIFFLHLAVDMTPFAMAANPGGAVLYTSGSITNLGAPITINLNASQNLVQSGSLSTLSWLIFGGGSCTSSWSIGPIATQGTATIGPSR